MLPEDTTHVRWFLNINNEKRYVSKDITIKDQIQYAQRFLAHESMPLLHS
nr:hypothetical protein [Staphylococcus aureus]